MGGATNLKLGERGGNCQSTGAREIAVMDRMSTRGWQRALYQNKYLHFAQGMGQRQEHRPQGQLPPAALLHL